MWGLSLPMLEGPHRKHKKGDGSETCPWLSQQENGASVLGDLQGPGFRHPPGRAWKWTGFGGLQTGTQPAKRGRDFSLDREPVEPGEPTSGLQSCERTRGCGSAPLGCGNAEGSKRKRVQRVCVK